MNTMNLEHGTLLVRPLKPGDPIVYWQLGDTVEQRFDVPDAPMEGEMDPFFFLTKHKNFIPHEYPCRTVFGPSARGRRPDCAGAFDAARATGCRSARRGSICPASGSARPGSPPGRARSLSPRRRARRSCASAPAVARSSSSMAPKRAGWQIISAIWKRESEFEVAAERGRKRDPHLLRRSRRARCALFLPTRLCPRPGRAAGACPSSCEPAVASAVEAMLDDMHFEQPTYKSGEVALVTGAPLPVAADVSIGIAGDFMSTESIDRQFATEGRPGAAANRPVRKPACRFPPFRS